MHTPVGVTEAAVAAFRAARADCVVALGADQVVVVPATYAGSEMTDVLGETAGGEKTTRRDASIRPEVLVYDVDLTLTLPVGLTVTSALNAIAHVMEGFYAPDRNPVTDLLGRDALKAFSQALPVLMADPQNASPRADALYAAWGCSTALGQVSIALHHKLAHVLGGSFRTPHAETHAILLPHTTRYNMAAVPDLPAPITETFGGGAQGQWQFAKGLGAPMALREFGLTEADMDHAAEIATKNPYANPAPVTKDGIRQLLQNALTGEMPQ